MAPATAGTETQNRTRIGAENTCTRMICYNRFHVKQTVFASRDMSRLEGKWIGFSALSPARLRAPLSA